MRSDLFVLLAVVAGYSFSADFQLPGSGYDQTHNGDSDAFILVTDMGQSVVQTLGANLTGTPVSGTLPFNSMMCADSTYYTGMRRCPCMLQRYKHTLCRECCCRYCSVRR